MCAKQSLCVELLWHKYFGCTIDGISTVVSRCCAGNAHQLPSDWPATIAFGIFHQDRRQDIHRSVLKNHSESLRLTRFGVKQVWSDLRNSFQFENEYGTSICCSIPGLQKQYGKDVKPISWGLNVWAISSLGSTINDNNSRRSLN